MNIKDLPFEEVRKLDRTFNIEKLLEAGYMEYPDSIHPVNRRFQKTIQNVINKKKYFIFVERWNWDKIRDTSLNDNPNYEFSSEVIFFLQDETSFRVKYDINSVKTTIIEMEEFFEDIYQKMKCIPDIHNN